MKNFLYVDNSNLWIEGMRLSAVKIGMAPNIAVASEQRMHDHSWRVDFGKIYQFAGGSNPACARLYGSRPPPNDSLWNVARAKGFEPIVFDRNFNNREKRVDTQITADIMEDLYERIVNGDEITLVAGDRDYVSVCEKAIRRGITFEVCFWSHSTSNELRNSCTRFIALDH